ncbi:MAG: acetaldehyde dehydrogenase (acetylating) [Propionibacteriaceae bacterium]|jgi:acetaldehyde dehydrogenase (acetylating)|nr:acetaldehyde dehydrogenase (acetylating) [Propionibacteriaceae bacterium]
MSATTPDHPSAAEPELADRDLVSVQETRRLVAAAKAAQAELAGWSQERLDGVCAALARAGAEQAADLAQLACRETGFGLVKDKTIKNRFGSETVWQAVRGLTAVGVLSRDEAHGLVEIGVPMGVIAALVPSTNPTSTVLFKSIIALKAGNAIVFSPHPAAVGCINQAARLMSQAAVAAGCPPGAIGCVSRPTMEATAELLRHRDIALILATGGGPMVKAAYSSGNPAIGVGPGNGPAFIERSADIPLAVKRILDSKCFDNGTICASEQSVVTEDIIKDQVVAEFERQGAHFLNPAEKAQLAAVLMRPNGTMNPAVVGRSAAQVARLAGFEVPENTRVLIGHETEVGPDVPFSKEKLCPVLAFYSQPDWERACQLCIRLLLHEGAGHTMMIHSRDEAVIEEFGLKKPVSRLLVNTPGALGGVGATTDLAPSLTLGCGAVGGSSSSDNIGPLNLINIRRVARGRRELEDLEPAGAGQVGGAGTTGMTAAAEDELVERVLRRLLEKLTNERSLNH